MRVCVGVSTDMRACQLVFPADASQIGFALPITRRTLGNSVYTLPPRAAFCLQSLPLLHLNPINPLKTIWTSQCSGTATARNKGLMGAGWRK